MKPFFKAIVIGLMILSVFPFAPKAFADPETSYTEPIELEEDYTGVSLVQADLEFNNGNAVCRCKVMSQAGYYATVTIKLIQDGSNIKTWYYAGTVGEYIRFEDTYGAVSGSLYKVIALVRVYNSSGVFICTILCNSALLACP